jgi:hypothetical protein
LKKQKSERSHPSNQAFNPKVVARPFDHHQYKDKHHSKQLASKAASVQILTIGETINLELQSFLLTPDLQLNLQN